MPAIRKPAAAAAVLLLMSVSGCGSTLADPDAGPADTIDAWAEVACAGSKVQHNKVDAEPNLFAETVVASAHCDLPIDGTAYEKSFYIEVHSTENGVKTRLANSDCENGFLKVVGPTWYSSMMSDGAATALQDAGGELAC